MSELDPEFLQQLQEAFVIEAREQLQNFMGNVIKLEQSTGEEEKLALTEDILHDLHSMKGNSRAAGIIAVETICQSLESALLSLRRKKELLSAEAADVFHQAIDILDNIITKVEGGEADFVPEALQATLQQLKMLDERQRLAAEAAASGSSDKDSPAVEGSPIIADTTNKVEASSVQSAAPAMPANQEAAKASTKAAGADKSASTRIALWKLDKLLRESEEMLILKQISEEHLQDIKDLKMLAKTLEAESDRLQKLIQASSLQTNDEITGFADSLKIFAREMQQATVAKLRRQQTEQRLAFNLVDGFIDSVKSLLMQDFSSLLSVIPKVVRDLGRELKKEVDLEIFGTEIEIDRRILEEIKDPLLHLVRNSLDHGIESSDKREESGKPARALLKIGARQDESGNVQLIISDDGRGISVAKLKSVAVQEGVLSADEASRMSDHDALELMYRSSISTSDAVTEISGRGLGMAIVKERIHDLGGRVLVETQLGKGTTFTLQLPTKLSTFRGIQIVVADQSFIVPTLNVHYAGRIARSDIKPSGSRNVVTVNGQLTSVQTLSDVLQMESQVKFRSRAARKYHQLLVLESGEGRAGFLVDEILHEHEVLVRGLSYPLVRVPNISGATILGSGQVVPVLNITDLMETSSKAGAADEKLRVQLAQESERQSKISEYPVFLVDRHGTSLVMIKSLLESEGYIVNTFDSNETALEGLDVDVPLILLKSSELPETQESGLAYWIRKDLRLKDLPIVFFGSFAKKEGEEFSADAGGDAYFSKIDFNRNQLLQLIEKLT